MSSSSKAGLEGVGFNSDDPGRNAAEHGDGPYEDQDQDGERDEDGDVDFIPSLGEPLSPEASSSLSSEIECLDLHVFENDEINIESADIVSTNLTDGIGEYGKDDSDRGDDDFLMEYSTFPGGMYETAEEEENGASSATDVNDEDSARKLSSDMHDNNPLMDFDDEDAICKRTRARYSLASFTLDELETFLQETDDEDDIQNVDVDEEEEYRKFLASVLLGGDGDSHADQENVIVDDDDDNDADFVIEIEEALEGDLDANIYDNTENHECEETSRRPETRQTKRQKKYEIEQNKLLQQMNRPLRPLVPVMSNAPLIHFHASECFAPSADYGFINGFTPHQIFQLHNLIYEHVQLLIQIFSICVLDPARQHVASQVQGLISDMLNKRDQALASRKVAYPANCFSRPFVHPMVPTELPRGSPPQSISESVTPNAQRDPSSLEQPPLQNISSSEIRNKHDISQQYGYSQTIDGFSWIPFIDGPLLSILDVAPLHLVARYMDDVKIAVQDYRKHLLEDTRDPSVDAGPMFPLHGFPPSASRTAESPIQNSTRTADTLPSSSPIQQPPKKTMAAALVESSMKQSVALVPKVIVKLSERFFQLFNPALFPRKPPPGSVVNRVLFTDAEDELLALGLMEYNTDWKAIQQRFLPCKSKHQIFVRQKNRSSGKALENPIKAVKRMKNSPLTEDELARIEEGLRIFKLDWKSVWKFMVPHRDPSLLPRQWRTAIGTQRSYKTDPEKREKRRLHGLKRRQRRVNLTNMKPEGEDDGSENPGQNGEDSTCNEDETYVHKAFLADWRPGTSSSLVREGTAIRERLSENNTVKELTRAPINSWHLNASSNFTHAGSPGNILRKPNPLIPGPSRPQVYMRPYRARRAYNQQCVKLSPELPPVTLPSSARIISKSALKNIRCEPSASISGGGIGTQNGINIHTNNSNLVTVHRTNAQEHSVTPSLPEETSVMRNDTEPDLHMHPLLFKAPNEGHLPYYPLKSGINSSSSFSFCTKNQPELNLLHNPHQADASANYFKDYGKSKEDNPSSFGFDFHPLLQIGACSNARRQEKSDTNQREFPFNGNPSATSTKRYSLNDSSSANELDLDIHLTVTSRMDSMSSTNVAKQHNPTRSSVRIPKEVAHNNRTLNCEATTPSNNISGCRIDNVGDQSLQEIVMEHEELSDSDEEIDGHVQFECEEMADSEGEEGSACEQSVNTHNKGTQNNAEEKVSSAVANANKLNYAERNSTWLSLNSFVPGPS